MSEHTFGHLGLPDAVLESIRTLGFVTPTPIQRESIPILLEGRDLIGKAETGTGKTLAFCAPIMSRIEPHRVAVQALVLCPTRELAHQVHDVTVELGESLGARSALVVGGVHQGEQILKLRQGAHIVVGTPGRVLDFLQGGRLSLGWVEYLVLDEADRMLDMGFIDEVSAILERTPPERQTMLFSATIPPRLRSLTQRFMKDPHTVSTTPGLATVPEIRQLAVFVHAGDKEGFILDLLDRHPDDTCIIFCNTRREVIELDRTLWGLGYPAGSLHGEHEQERRFRILEAFKKREITALVATDVAGRGLDIEEVGRVVNYDVPDEVETYVHRIGRTGRAGGVGESITLISRAEGENWRRIVRSTGFEIEELPFEPTRPRRKLSESRGGRGRGRGGREARGGRSGDARRGAREGRRGGAPSRSGPGDDGGRRGGRYSRRSAGKGGRRGETKRAEGGRAEARRGPEGPRKRPPRESPKAQERPEEERKSERKRPPGGASSTGGEGAARPRRRRRPRRKKA